MQRFEVQERCGVLIKVLVVMHVSGVEGNNCEHCTENDVQACGGGEGGISVDGTVGDGVINKY